MKEIVKQILLTVFGVLFLTACSNSGDSDVYMLGEIEMINGEGHVILPSGLSIDIYELEGLPEADSFIFVPISGRTQDEVLSLHEEARELGFPDDSFFDEMRFCMRSQGQEQIVTACEFVTEAVDGRGSMCIEVMLDDVVVFTAEAGDVSPISPLRGVWSFEGDWVLEYAYTEMTIEEDENVVYGDSTGQLVWNGDLLNEALQTDEIFGFQLMNHRPFYFFDKDGEVGIVFDGIVTPLGFDDVPHYGCCSAGILNPRQAQNMVAFFAERDARWHYVEIGVYD